jgi:hypothetical protein
MWHNDVDDVLLVEELQVPEYKYELTYLMRDECNIKLERTVCLTAIITHPARVMYT